MNITCPPAPTSVRDGIFRIDRSHSPLIGSQITELLLAASGSSVSLRIVPVFPRLRELYVSLRFDVPPYRGRELGRPPTEARRSVRPAA